MDSIIPSIFPKALVTQSLYYRALEHLGLALEAFACETALQSETAAASPKPVYPED